MDGDRWGKAPAQPAPVRQAEAPASPSQSRERPRLTLAPRSDEPASSQEAPAQPKKKVLTLTHQRTQYNVPFLHVHLFAIHILSCAALKELLGSSPLTQRILRPPAPRNGNACCTLRTCVHHSHAAQWDPGLRYMIGEHLSSQLQILAALLMLGQAHVEVLLCSPIPSAMRSLLMLRRSCGRLRRERGSVR